MGLLVNPCSQHSFPLKACMLFSPTMCTHLLSVFKLIGLCLRSQIDAMEDELTEVTKTQTELEMTIDETKGKLSATTHELNAERKRGSNLTMVQSRLFKDMKELNNILQDGKALKDSVGSMCKKYIKHLDASGGPSTIEDETETKKAFEEIMRQKAFLER